MIVAGWTDSCLLDLITGGVHDPDDDYALALYSSSANLGPQTTAYTTLGEVRAMGYDPGGHSLSGRRTGLVDGKAWLNFDDEPWPNVSLVSRGGLVFNKSKGNKSVFVVDFGDDIRSTNHEFLARFPQDGAEAAAVLTRSS